MTQLYPALDSATEAALRASIIRFGVLVPVVVDQDGELLDGHHRSRIAGELNLVYDVVTRVVTDDDERREISRTLNEDRRMLTREQRLPVVKALREEGHSFRAIGAALGMSKSQAKRDHEESGVPLGTPGQTTGLDGKTYPASRPKTSQNGRAMPVVREASTERQQQIVRGARERVEKAVGACNGMARGLDELNVETAVVGASEDEMDGWDAAFRDGIAAIKRLRTRLKEAR